MWSGSEIRQEWIKARRSFERGGQWRSREYLEALEDIIELAPDKRAQRR